MSLLTHYVHQTIRRLGGTVALVAKNLDTGETIAINPDEPFPSASIIKVLILIEVYRQVAAGRLSLDTIVPLDPQAVVGGSGILFELHAGIPLTVQDLVHLMITLSDNTASNLLIERCGIETLIATANELGLKKSRIQRRFFDYEARARGRDNWATAGDMVHLFDLLVRGELPASDTQLAILARCQDRTKMALYFPEEHRIAHKSGEIEGVRHDGGVVYRPGATPDAWQPAFLFCMLTRNQANVLRTDQAIGRLCRRVYQTWVKE